MTSGIIVDSYDPKRPLSIFVTKDDRTSSDITKMSDFITKEIKSLSYSLITESKNKIVKSSIIDTAAISNALLSDGVVVKNGYEYVPDFNSLPKDILSKYRKGTYRLGESKTVDGNLRAVIVNKKGVRVKDVTLKKVNRINKNAGQLQSLAIQNQLKQINEKLDTLIELQDYHIEFDRNNSLIKPFFNARDNVVHAQNEKNPERKRSYLDNAVSQLEDGINAIYLDVGTVQKRFFRCTWLPVFRPTNLVDRYIGFITQDLQVLAIYTSILLQVLNYLGKASDMMDAFNRYRDYMLRIYTEDVGRKQLPLSVQIHKAIKYSREDMDTWQTMTDSIVPLLQNEEDIKGAYIISTEDCTDEQE